MQWLKEGDNKTRFYHSLANGRKARNLISSLSMDGSLTKDPNLIKIALANLYNPCTPETPKEKHGFEVGTEIPFLFRKPLG